MLRKASLYILFTDIYCVRINYNTWYFPHTKYDNCLNMQRFQGQVNTEHTCIPSI